MIAFAFVLLKHADNRERQSVDEHDLSHRIYFFPCFFRCTPKLVARAGSDDTDAPSEFVIHFEEIDKTETPGEVFFGPRTYQLLTDSYIKERIKFSDSDKRYGADTYDAVSSAAVRPRKASPVA